MLLVAGSTDALGFIAVFWGCEVVTVPVCRTVGRAVFWRSSRLSERTLIVGAGAVGHLLGEKIAKHPEYNLKLVGYLDDGEPFGASKPPVPVVGRLEDLNDVIDGYHVTRVIIAFSRARHQQILDVVRACADRGVRVNIVPRLFEILSSQTAMDDVEGIPLLDVAHVEMSRLNTVVKRVFDLVVGGLTALVALPLIGVLALAIKLDSRGPVFFRQERMGRGGRVFRIFKLRSMHVDAEQLRYDLAEQNEYSGPMFKIKSDPRLTRVGTFIRKWSLDEVPQIFNVLRGEMSLVGPRPLWVDEAARCRGWTKKRLDITPGDHRSVAGHRPQRRALRRDGQARLHVRHGLEPELGHQAAPRDHPGRARQAGGVLKSVGKRHGRRDIPAPPGRRDRRGRLHRLAPCRSPAGRRLRGGGRGLLRRLLSTPLQRGQPGRRALIVTVHASHRQPARPGGGRRRRGRHVAARGAAGRR